MHRKSRWPFYYLGLLALCLGTYAIAPSVAQRVARTFGWSVLGVVQAAIVLFALLPAAGLLWFAWHMLFHRRMRMLRLRRIRYRQGRSVSLLSPPPIFGGAYESKGTKGIDRNRGE